MSDYEGGDTGGYLIMHGPGHQSPSRTRNIVIERAIRYANHMESPHLWVDQDCIDQTDKAKKQLAMDSMDLVYSGSKYPVGLMSTVLDSERDISLLHDLLCGNLVSEDCESTAIGSQKVEQVLNLLCLFSQDHWWRRAWIFQEEYLAGTSMNILIRHSPELEGFKRDLFRNSNKEDTEDDEDDGEGEQYDDEDVFIEGEISFGATNFREVTTIFLLALRKLPSTQRQQKSTKLLEIFGKYNVLYDLTKFAQGKAMSFRVVADVHKRDASEDYDKLSIAANSCDYATRFNAMDMAKTAYSVNLCTLAMILLNGEIIANGKEHLSLPTEMGLVKYLDHISFDKFEPPFGQKELTWLKNCRLPNPELVPSGIKSTGYLWSVQATMYTDKWRPLSGRYSRRIWKDGLNDKQRLYLFELIQKLRGWGHSGGLRKELSKYLRRDMESRYSPPRDRERAVKRYKDVMAREVCLAIQERRPLYLAAVCGTKALKAIFVGSCCHQGVTMFTAWSHNKDKDHRIRTRHLSLSVYAQEKLEGTHIRIQKWVNGLVFFNTSQQESIIVSWPEAWLRTNPEVIELSDDEDA
jgi:hypothetical protein